MDSAFAIIVCAFIAVIVLAAGVMSIWSENNVLRSDNRCLRSEIKESEDTRLKYADEIDELRAEIMSLSTTVENYRSIILSARSERPEHKNESCCDLMPARRG